DPAAIAEVREEAWPDVRDDDELADVLHTLIALPEECGTALPGCVPWKPYFEQLQGSHRAARARVRDESQAGALHNNCDFWVSAEKAKAFRSIYPDAQFEDQLPEVPGEAPPQEDALKAALTGWLAHLGPTTASTLAELLRLPVAEIEKALLRIEST